MFVGHYGVSFMAKRAAVSIPLWMLFLAVQLLDVLWAPLVLLGVEKVRIVPGFTATNPLDLYYMPYTHSLVAASVWSIAAAFAYRRIARSADFRAGMMVGLAVFSHWLLDLLVHKPDLPLYDNALKVGLGLWDRPALALGLEAILLFGGMWLLLARRPMQVLPLLVLGLVMLAVQVYVFFGPPPPSPAAAAGTALIGYAAFAVLIWWVVDRRR
jgi:hypothetical protein